MIPSPKMHEFSTVDGFVEISEGLAEIMKYVANEPSSGLFYIQHHAQNAVPNVIEAKRNIVEKSHETTLHAEDLEDSVTMVRSMKECGFSLADEMIRDIKKSLVTMTTKQPKRGLIRQSPSGSRIERTSLWGEGSEKRSNYLSSVFSSAKQKASSLRWPNLDTKESMDSKGEKPDMYSNLPLTVTSASTNSSLQGIEAYELPVSSQVEDECQHQQNEDSDVNSTKLLSISENYDDFKANKEAKLEEWLQGTGNLENNRGAGRKVMPNCFQLEIKSEVAPNNVLLVIETGNIMESQLHSKPRT
ncbi:hypothetical protein Ahy_B09g098883 isoform F [Arachis hypogaea]|uniref:Uncharacterized protein n=1 Tax=Arachis hypogaea TaxID=3818 RepID=A0A444XSG8_ARAHY|nr:hypothetical protein Ahy_B09g098883 isoform F [Arachis hypogaea]